MHENCVTLVSTREGSIAHWRGAEKYVGLHWKWLAKEKGNNVERQVIKLVMAHGSGC